MTDDPELEAEQTEWEALNVDGYFSNVRNAFQSGFFRGIRFERARQSERLRALERVVTAAKGVLHDYECAVECLEADPDVDPDGIEGSRMLLKGLTESLDALDHPAPIETEAERKVAGNIQHDERTAVTITDNVIKTAGGDEQFWAFVRALQTAAQGLGKRINLQHVLIVISDTDVFITSDASTTGNLFQECTFHKAALTASGSETQGEAPPPEKPRE